MNKIIWKNKESTDITGLLICELPSITKPKMRVQETFVDGVDGSIIEELGYETYNKKIKIGLYGTYDINEIINYFSGEGQITFSNEPDKYYNAKIIEQIDYTRLLRFKEATVTFKVQPYKYKLDETIVNSKTGDYYVANNLGNEKSKPLIKISGSGIVEVIINNISTFKYTFSENESEVYIDSEKQDAYYNGDLKNRNMLGDFPILETGENTIEFSGDVLSVEILPRSRWL